MNLIATKMLRYVSAVGILLVGSGDVHAVIVTDSGVDVVNKHYVIDASVSTVTYKSDIIIWDGTGTLGSSDATHVLSGTFDVEFQHHWWNYVYSDIRETPMTTSSDWIRFTNAVISTNGLPPGFEFPRFSVQSGPAEFSGISGPCAFPMGPDTHCSGISMGGSSGLTGLLQDGRIIFDGYQSNWFGGDYTYHVEAAVVPVPAAFWLFASMLGFWGIRPRPKLQAV